ncbi:LOW QUALITY PROTEIN: zinc finger protein 271 [Drosophila sulfurigaster albostrigata]|uniref:LOW QUALITY PROTEIN: zinc finger protein 271 n=1 Tax=Drosophila sulfurigaster albostrigata TaxID=89887 RepID=UPI002D21CA7C|nr:LOW QUALITY PROTEIN: zinc finger protein 271 [Drosophila sulfurigaster albostrigata]
MNIVEAEIPSSFNINISLNAQTCRVCLQSHETTLCLRDEIEYNDLNVELWQLLENVSNVKCIWNEPNLPTQLCQSCTRRLISAYEFIREVERSQQTLQEICNSLEQDQSTMAVISDVNVDGVDVPEHANHEELLHLDECESIIELHEVELEQSDEVSNNATEETEPDDLVKRRECPHCGISFPVSSLTIHIRRHTGENEHCPYKCDQCEKALAPKARSQDLSLHKRIHTGERPSECKICAKKFISQNKLARHMRLHTGQRPYACDRCEKSFVQSNDLKIHMRRHTGERPYICGVCDKSFVCGSLLNIHRNQKHHFEGDEIANTNAKPNPDPYENSRVNKRRAEDIERIRLQREQKPTLPIMLRPYTCGVCGDNFKSGALLTIHRNKMAHYERAKVNYGDPYEQKYKQQQHSKSDNNN